MASKQKSKYIKAKKVTPAKKECTLKLPKRSNKRLVSAIKAVGASKKKHTSLLGKMKGTVLYESDLISPIEETWDVDSDKE